MSDFKLTVILEGEETRDPDARYPTRETLAKVELPVYPSIGWDIYQYVIARAVVGVCALETE